MKQSRRNPGIKRPPFPVVPGKILSPDRNTTCLKCRKFPDSLVLVQAVETNVFATKRETLDPGNSIQRTVGMSRISEITGSRKVSSRGYIIYEVTVCHAQLGKKKVLRSEYPLMLERQAHALATRWDESWEKKPRANSPSSSPNRETDAISNAPAILSNGHPIELDTSI